MLTTESEQTAWVNNFHQPVNFTCPKGKFLTGVSSRHSNGHEDRIFKYHCSDISLYGTKVKPETCEIKKNVNGWDGQLVFACPDQKVLIGESSVHHRVRKDRRFSFNCCDIKHPFAKVKIDKCTLTPFVNGFDAFFDFKCPKNTVLKGTHSYHNNKTEDRRFRFNCCSLKEDK